MRFLIDESADARVAPFLKELGHDAATVAQSHRPGIPDPEILAIALAESRILITDDRDFGDLVFRYGNPHSGVIYFRLRDPRLETRLRRLIEVLTRHADRLDEFIVVTERGERVRRRPDEGG